VNLDGGTVETIPERRSAPARATAFFDRATGWRRADPDHAPAEVERFECGRDDRGEHGASAQPRETA
jgi:hypothetical protein